MMGLGSYGYGGSSSASNLSALAPPFTVDGSAPKTNSNTLVDFTVESVELPYAAVPLNSSLHNWMPPHYTTPRPDLFSSPNPEDEPIHTSSGGYKYPGSQSINPPTTLLPSLNLVATAAATAFPYGQCSEGITSNLVEAKPYYPSFVSMAIHNDGPMGLPDHSGYDLLSSSYASALNGSSHDDCNESLTGLEYTSQWNGVWNGLADWNRDKRVEIDGNFYPKETTSAAGPPNCKNYMNQGLPVSKGLSAFEELPHGIDMISREKGVGSIRTKQLDDKSFSGQNSKFMPFGYSNTSVLGSAMLPETHSKEPSAEHVLNSRNHSKEPCVEYISNPRNHKLPYGSYDKVSTQHDISMSHSTSAAFPVPASRLPAVRTNYLAPNTVSIETVSVGKDVANMDSCVTNPSGMKETRVFQSSDDKGHFDASYLSIHLNRNDHFVVESSAAKYNELSCNKNVSNNVSDNFFEAKSETQIPHASPDLFSVALDCKAAVNSAENFSESFDHYNTAVDSPCWKGVPFSRFSPFKVSEAATCQQLKNLEECQGFNLRGPHSFSLGDDAKVSSQVPGETAFFHENGCFKNGLVSPLKNPSVDHLLFREHGLDNATEAGFYHSRLSHEPRKEYTLPGKSVCDSDFRPSHPMQQTPEEMASKKKVTSGISVADSGINIIDASEDASSNVPFEATESVLRSPSSVENAPAKPLKLHGEQSTTKIDVQMLIKTMHNLSEMLLIHCSNDACEMEEKDHVALKYVISNLETCMLKNLEHTSRIQEPMLSQGGSCQFLGQLPDPHKGVGVDGPWVTKAAAMNVQDQLDHQYVQKENEDHSMLAKKDEKVSDIVFLKGDVDIVNDDDMTQAIKKVLSENLDDEEETQPQVLLYKNLWLEAEAALCSVNYRARFNRMKIDMEKYKRHKAKGVLDNATDVKPSRPKASAVLSTVNKLTPAANSVPAAEISTQDSMISTNGNADDIMARLRILHSRIDDSNSFNSMNEQDLSNYEESPQLNTVEKLATDAKDGPTPDVSILDSHLISTNSHADDVMSRYHILKCRVDDSNSMNAVDEQDTWNSQVSADSNKVEKLATEAKGSETPDICIQDSPISSGMSHAGDVETSVLARFHILKSRVDNSGSFDMERQQLLDVDLGFAGKRAHWSFTREGLEEGSSNVNLKAALEHHNTNYTEDKLTVNEYHQRPGNQVPAGWFDSSSSDWEHVLKEDLPGQN